VFLAGNLRAQPASISDSPQPFFESAAFDAAGNQYYFGTLGPVTAGAPQTQNGGGTCLFSNGFFSVPGPCNDAYVSKVDASGNQIFGTFLGGSTADQATALAVDAAGNVFFTGSTDGSFPTSAEAANAGSNTAKAFAAKLSADGSQLLYSTYLPDTAATASAIALDGQGDAYIAGKSSTGHAYVVKLSSDGSAFLYNVSLGGTMQDSAAAIHADAAGNVIVAGPTSSPDFFVTPGAVQSELKGAQNVFVARLDASGNVVFATYLGGSGTDAPAAVQTDSTGNIYVAGRTNSLDFPTTSGSFEPAPGVPLWNNTGPGGFVARLSPDGSALAWSSYVMSADHGQQQGVAQLAVTASGESYLAGVTGPGFPSTPSAPQICFGGSILNFPVGLLGNVFVAHLDADGALLEATCVGRQASASALSLAGDDSVLLVRREGKDVKSRIQFGGAGWTAPACLTPDVLNAATLSGNSAQVAPGELITLTGFEIGPDLGVAYQPGAQGEAPLQLAGVQVLFDGKPAPVLYAQSRQINALAPRELSGQTQTTITVNYNEATIGSIAASVQTVGLPGIFRLQPGVSSQAAAINEDGTLNGPSNPAPRGSVVSVWGTGFGPLDPPCATGSLNAPGPVNLAAGFSVRLRDTQAPPSPDVLGEANPALYAGGAPTLLCGVVQINMLVPDYAAPGVFQFLPWSLMTRPAGDSLLAAGNTTVTIFVN
jgi:uncharacterized protein (TIGR03437 family)